MVSEEYEATKRTLRCFFEQVMKEFLFYHSKISRKEFFIRLEYFIQSKDKNITLSIDEKMVILLLLSETLANYIGIGFHEDTQNGERYIAFYIDPYNFKEWETMINCIYDERK